MKNCRYCVACTVLMSMAAAIVADDPVINEWVANHVGADNHEYVELFGDADTDYRMFTIIELEGDANKGVVDSVFPLGFTDAAGIWVSEFQAGEIENGTITLLLVRDFTGDLGDDLDTDDDGSLDSFPWSAIIDGIAVNDGGEGDRTYGGVPVLLRGFDGVNFPPGGASRIPNGVDTDTIDDWMRNDFDGAGLPGFEGSPREGEALNTPGKLNEAIKGPGMLDVTPADGFESAGPVGGPFEPVSKIYTIENIGFTTVEWFADDNVDWITTSPNEGELAPLETVEITVEVNDGAKDLEQRVYDAVLDIRNTTNGNGDTSRPIRLTVGGASCEPCDANCDGSVDLTDVEPFIRLLFGEDPCSACAGDTNKDGSVDLTDVEGFIECLLG